MFKMNDRTQKQIESMHRKQKERRTKHYVFIC